MKTTDFSTEGLVIWQTRNGKLPKRFPIVLEAPKYIIQTMDANDFIIEDGIIRKRAKALGLGVLFELKDDGSQTLTLYPLHSRRATRKLLWWVIGWLRKNEPIFEARREVSLEALDSPSPQTFSRISPKEGGQP